MKTDYNCFVGTWPFAKRKQIDFDGLRSMHQKHGIETGLVSSLGAVFYNDPFEGDLELSVIIKSSGYRLAASINPMLPNTMYDIKRADESFEYDAFRIYPTVHGYDFDTPEFREFYQMASERGKPIIVHCSFGDYRLDYLFKQKSFEMASLDSFLKRELKTPVLLCNMKLSELEGMVDTLSNEENIFIDMSEIRHSMFVVEDLTKMGLIKKTVFGSFYPMFDFLAAFIHFNGVDNTLKNTILNRKICD